MKETSSIDSTSISRLNILYARQISDIRIQNFKNVKIKYEVKEHLGPKIPTGFSKYVNYSY